MPTRALRANLLRDLLEQHADQIHGITLLGRQLRRSLAGMLLLQLGHQFALDLRERHRLGSFAARVEALLEHPQAALQLIGRDQRRGAGGGFEPIQQATSPGQQATQGVEQLDLVARVVRAADHLVPGQAGVLLAHWRSHPGSGHHRGGHCHVGSGGRGIRCALQGWKDPGRERCTRL